jgi:hypothetical protein
MIFFLISMIDAFNDHLPIGGNTNMKRIYRIKMEFRSGEIPITGLYQ